MRDEKITFRNGIEIFINDLIVNNKSNNTIEAYKTDMNIFLEFIDEVLNKKIIYTCDLKTSHLEDYKSYLVINRGYSIRGASRKYNCLRSYIKTLNKYNLVNLSILMYLSNDSFGNKKKDKFTDKIKLISNETIEKILENIKNSNKTLKYRDVCIIKLLLYLGLRRSEILNLKWNQIDLINNTIKIIRNKNSTINIVNLPTLIIEDLKKLNKISIAENKGILPNYVFHGVDIDKPLSICSYNNIISLYTKNLKDIDGNKVTGHAFRHTFITNCIRKNIPLSEVMALTGLDLKTLEYYSHIVPNNTLKFNSLVDNLYEDTDKIPSPS
ncbi:tyrosine-type recombinase/integrase [Clostridium baratii]